MSKRDGECCPGIVIIRNASISFWAGSSVSVFFRGKCSSCLLLVLGFESHSATSLPFFAPWRFWENPFLVVNLGITPLHILAKIPKFLLLKPKMFSWRLEISLYNQLFMFIPVLRKKFFRNN